MVCTYHLELHFLPFRLGIGARMGGVHEGGVFLPVALSCCGHLVLPKQHNLSLLYDWFNFGLLLS